MNRLLYWLTGDARLLGVEALDRVHVATHLPLWVTLFALVAVVVAVKVALGVRVGVGVGAIVGERQPANMNAETKINASRQRCRIRSSPSSASLTLSPASRAIEYQRAL